MFMNEDHTVRWLVMCLSSDDGDVNDNAIVNPLMKSFSISSTAQSGQ